MRCWPAASWRDRPGRVAPPRARRCVWNPPLLDAELGIRASTLGEAADADGGAGRARPAHDRVRKSRKACELVHRYARQGLLLNAPELAPRIAPYRAGYTPEQRREIETGLTEGGLLGVVATSALELGVDIGLLDCAISVGFPGGMASLRQQWGRAGRRGLGLGMLVAGEDQLDQYLANHPDELLARPAEAAVSNPGNPAVLAGHLRCAAAELPLTDADRAHFGDAGLALAESMPDLVRTPAGLAYRGTDHPGRAHVAALVLAGLGGGGRARDRHAAGNGGRRPRRLDRARGRRLPAPGRAVPGRLARPRRPRGAGDPVRRRLLHAGEAAVLDQDRPRAGDPRAAGGAALVRRDRGHRAGGRLPAQAAVRPPADRPGGAGHAGPQLRHARRSGSCPPIRPAT